MLIVYIYYTHFLAIFNYNISWLSQFHPVIKENDSFPIRQSGIGIPQANICAQTYSQLKVGVGHTVEMFFLKVNLLGGTLPVGLFYSCTSCEYRIQCPDDFLPEQFLRVMFAESSLEGWGNVSLHEIEQVCYNRGRFLNSRFFNCDTKLCTTSAPPCCPRGTWEASEMTQTWGSWRWLCCE